MNVEEIFKQHFPNKQWKISNPPDGMSSQVYIADGGQEKVFIKLSPHHSAAVKRLAELGLTPSVLFSGTYDNQPYIIQEFIDGKYPDRKWFANNLDTLAMFIHKYHSDDQLKQLLTSDELQTYEGHIKNELTVLEQSISESGSDVFDTKEVRDAIHLLKEKCKKLKVVPLVPTHADPNSKNFLLTSKGIMMVDWDDIILSDPMKDIGVMLWWYVPKEKWKIFFEHYGQEIDEDKIYWWTARASIQIATWFAKRGDRENAQFFINDFLRAIEGKENSQILINNPND